MQRRPRSKLFHCHKCRCFICNASFLLACSCQRAFHWSRLLDPHSHYFLQPCPTLSPHSCFGSVHVERHGQQYSYMLKSTASSIASLLCQIFNLSISSGLAPLDWKFSLTVSIPKSSPLSNLPNLYRPISLLSLTSKLLEKHIHQIFLNHCLSHSFISHYQFGFLSHCSTSPALLYSTHAILSLLESHPSVCGVFLDLRKAILILSPISPYSTPLSLFVFHPTSLTGFTLTS